MNYKCPPAHPHKKVCCWQQCMRMFLHILINTGYYHFLNVFANFIRLHSLPLPPLGECYLFTTNRLFPFLISVLNLSGVILIGLGIYVKFRGAVLTRVLGLFSAYLLTLATCVWG